MFRIWLLFIFFLTTELYSQNKLENIILKNQPEKYVVEVQTAEKVDFVKKEWNNKIIIKLKNSTSFFREEVLFSKNETIKSIRYAHHPEDDNSIWIVVDCYQKSLNKFYITENKNLIIEVFKRQKVQNEYPVPAELYKSLNLPNNSKIKVDDLSFINVKYFGFDEQTYTGEMIVNKKVANEVIEIFDELYKIKFPIKEISLVSKYNNSDSLSMVQNNTSAFNYRTITNSKKLSNHALGLAIDINPVQNPYIKKGKILPANGRIKRTKAKGVILKNDECYHIFIKRGWKWGGNWKSLKDYQHFEKYL